MHKPPPCPACGDDSTTVCPVCEPECFGGDPDRVETSPLDLARAENARLKAELAAIHKAMRDGADDALWPPGFTVAEAVARLVRLHDAVTSALQERA